MKKLNLLTLGVAMGAWLAAPALQAGIVGSPHDFSGEAWNISPTDPASVCGPCHQAHHAANNVIPLWSHQTSQGPWTMYSRTAVAGSQLDATLDPGPTGVSLGCLSCHDGTVAVNSYGGQAAVGGSSVTITNRALIGTDLTHSHPISFAYTATLTTLDKWIYNPDTRSVLVPSSGPFVSGNDMTVNGFLLGGNHRMECSSCHDVHNQEGTPYSVANNPKLVKIVGTQAGKGSLLCRSCHNK